MIGDDVPMIGLVDDNTPDERDAARRYVRQRCERLGADDAEELLAALGLLEGDEA